MAEAVPDISPTIKEEEEGGKAPEAAAPIPAPASVEAPPQELSSEEKSQIAKAMLDEADELFAEGQKGIKENKLEAAVDALGKCLEIRVSHFGEAAPETATTYYKYGCALLYKAVEDSGVFGTNMPEAVTGEESDNEGDDDDDAGAEAGAAEEGEGGEEEDSGGDMGLAWEMLETSRVIFSNLPGKSKELADVHEKLADIHMEQEVFDQAVEEYSKSLKYLGDCEGSQERAILGVLFQYSLALQMQNMYEEAEGKCKEAIAVCNAAIDKREALSTPEASKEAAELKEVLEDLNVKLEELTELANQERSAKATMQEAFSSLMGPLKGAMKAPMGSSSGAGASSSAAASTSSSAFDAPMLSSSSGAAAAPVTNIGIVGRGRNRVTLAPTAVASTSSATEPSASGSGAPKENAPPKRTRNLEDLMGGGDGATTTTSIEPKKAKVSFADPTVETN